MQNDTINWLLEDNEPSIRYRTLTELLDKPKDNEEVKISKEKVANCKNVERIFARRNEHGLFPHKSEYYGNWTTFNYLTILAELGLVGEDPRIWPIIDWILTPGDDKYEYFMQKEFAPYAYVLDDDNMGSCNKGGFLATLVRLGYLNDPRVKRLVDVYIDKCRWDGGYLCKWKKSNHKGQNPKSCYPATVPALLLYSVLPVSYRCGKYDDLIHYFTGRNMIFSKTEPGKILADLRIGLFDGGLSHILTIAYAMSRMGLGNIPQMDDVWNVLKNKPQFDGKYILEAANSKKAILMDKPGQPNKWVTFYMMLIEKYR